MEGLMEILGTKREEQESGSLPGNLLIAGQGQGKSQAPPNMKVAVKKVEKKKDDKAIWAESEFKAASGVVVKEQGDDRTVPNYDILYKQDMSAEDAFLNLGDKDTSSDHCTHLILKVELPGAAMKDISLEVLKDRVILQAPKHRLNVALPYPVKKDEGNAKWDKVKGILSITLPIDLRIKYVSRPEQALG